MLVTILPSPIGEAGIGHRVVKGTKGCRTLRRCKVSYMEGKKKDPQSVGVPQILGSVQERSWYQH